MYSLKELDFGRIYTIYVDEQLEGKELPIIRIHISESGDVNFSFWIERTGRWRYFNIEKHETYNNIARKFILSKQMYVTQDLPPMEQLCECLIEEVRYILYGELE